MKQTKLSKQQKKIIMILGKQLDKVKKKTKTTGIHRIELKREVVNASGELSWSSGRSLDYKPMTKVEIISVGRSIKRLEARGIIKHPQSYLNPKFDDISSFTLTDKEGLSVYKDLKKKEKKKRLV